MSKSRTRASTRKVSATVMKPVGKAMKLFLILAIPTLVFVVSMLAGRSEGAARLFAELTFAGLLVCFLTWRPTNRGDQDRREKR